MPIYGSDRIGTYNPQEETKINSDIFIQYRNYKRYELKDHLGNVRVTVSDSKRVSFVSETLVFSADIKTYTDYYAFGMEMVGRNWSEGEAYRFGHNGQEKSKEVGEDNYTAEFWEYDSQTTRRFNLDPKPNPAISDYATFALNPILFSDVKGDTIQVTSKFMDNKGLARVFHTWMVTKEGKDFSNLFSNNGKFSQMTVCFDTHNGQEWEKENKTASPSGNTRVYAIDKKTGKKRRLFAQEDYPDGGKSQLNANEYLFIRISIAEITIPKLKELYHFNEDKSTAINEQKLDMLEQFKHYSYAIRKKRLTTQHEVQHVIMIATDILKYNRYIRSGVTHHQIMKKDKEMINERFRAYYGTYYKQYKISHPDEFNGFDD